MILRRVMRSAVALLALGSGMQMARAADQALIDAAKKEGSVAWYTALIVNQFARPVAEAFEKKYGIKVDYVRANAGETILRIQNEAKAGRVMVDVFDSFGAPQLEKDGMLTSYTPENARRLPKEFYDPKGFWTASNLYVLTPGFNTDLVPKGREPKTFADLLDPKWRGKMAWSSNVSPASGPGFIGLVLGEMGEEKGMDYLRKLAGQRIAGIPLAARQVLDQVIAGEYSIALQIFNNHTIISKAQGAPSDWIMMQPALVALSVFSLPKNAPHPNAGKLLVDYIVSEEGQKAFRDADYMPVDPNVPPRDASLRPDGKTFRARYLTPDELDQALPVWGKIYNDLFR
jgi:ABC-type Fe3+ transport system substrate-binding protein